VYLPAQRTTKSATPAGPDERTALPAGRNELILLVDDEDSLRLVAGNILKRLGYRVLFAANGADAVTAYAHHQNEISVVITDMAMPVMDGPALIAILKTMNPDLKIIVSTGFAVDTSLDIAKKAGVRHFIHKPYTAEALLKVVREVLDPQS
jgi:CheY-like chemotaxis protein